MSSVTAGGSSVGGAPISFGPIILNLDGRGINITPLSQSNEFFNLSNDGTQHRTAWAAAGNGVLFYDPTHSGKITQENQVVFTQWDPSAKSDMQALLDVFDTNHNGKLDAGDAAFANFKIMVTNSDGTTARRKLPALRRVRGSRNPSARHSNNPTRWALRPWSRELGDVVRGENVIVRNHYRASHNQKGARSI